jgi:hypothetical protein
MEQLVDDTVAGHHRALIISGPAGLGKSFVVEEKLAEYDPDEENHQIVKGKCLATALYKLLHRFKEEGQILVLDDCDTIFGDETALNLLKAACDTTSRRRLTWGSEYVIVDEKTDEELPRSFDYAGTVIFITNHDFDEVLKKSSNKLAPHLNALMSRSQYINMGMRNPRERVVRIRQVSRETSYLKKRGLTDKQVAEVLDWIDENQTTMREVSLRTAIKIAGLLKGKNGSNWKMMAKITCCKPEIL